MRDIGPRCIATRMTPRPASPGVALPGVIRLATILFTVMTAFGVRAQADPTVPAEGLLFIVPDAQGGVQDTRDLVQGLVDSGLALQIRIHWWGYPVPGVGPFGQVITPAGNLRAARRLAREIAAHQQRHPYLPVFLVGCGAGGGIAVLTLETLGTESQGSRVAGAFLFAPRISAQHDLDRAMGMCRRGIVNVYTTENTLLTGSATGTTESVDGSATEIAGRIGFDQRYDTLFEVHYKGPPDRHATKSANPSPLTRQALIARYAPPWIRSQTWPPPGPWADYFAPRRSVHDRVKSDRAEQSPPSPEDLVQQDPRAFLAYCLEHGPGRLGDFRCRFVVNERLKGELTGEQRIAVRYQHEPRAVHMTWEHNDRGARRVLWVKDRHHNDKGVEQVQVQPAGLAGVFVSDVLLPIDDPRLMDASRKPMTEFGPEATLSWVVGVNERAARDGALELRYQGLGAVDGRATYVLIRELPYQAGSTAYPEARMVLHVDRELLVPLSIFSYADPAGRTLLASYQFIDLDPNVRWQPSDFQF